MAACAFLLVIARTYTLPYLMYKKLQDLCEGGIGVGRVRDLRRGKLGELNCGCSPQVLDRCGPLRLGVLQDGLLEDLRHVAPSLEKEKRKDTRISIAKLEQGSRRFEWARGESVGSGPIPKTPTLEEGPLLRILFRAPLSLSLSLFLSAPDSLKFSSSGEPGQRESSWQVSASLPYVLSVGSGHDHVPPGIQKVEGVERRDRHGCASFLSGVGVILSPAAPAAELPWSPRTLPPLFLRGASRMRHQKCWFGKSTDLLGGPGCRIAKQNQSFI